MTIHNPEIGETTSVERVIASAALPNERSGRAGKQVVHIIDSGSKVHFEITGLDPTNFEAVVGPKTAEEYRAYVQARRSKVKPKAGRRVGRIRGLLHFGNHI